MRRLWGKIIFREFFEGKLFFLRKMNFRDPIVIRKKGAVEINFQEKLTVKRI